MNASPRNGYLMKCEGKEAADDADVCLTSASSEHFYVFSTRLKQSKRCSVNSFVMKSHC